jgi:ribonuclease-3 family protein
MEQKKITEEEAKLRKSLNLAYIGDAYFSLKIKEFFILDGEEKKTEKLHQTTSDIVRASFQAKIFESLMSELTENEKQVAIRAKNAKANNVPKNASRSQYQKATALEAVIGFNFLTGNETRLENIIKRAITLSNQIANANVG